MIISIPLNLVSLGSSFVLFHPLHDRLTSYIRAILVDTYVTVFSKTHFTADPVETRRFADDLR